MTVTKIIRCKRCSEFLTPKNTVWLQYSNKTGLFSDPNVVSLPESELEGNFPFGINCAKEIVAANGLMWDASLGMFFSNGFSRE